MTHWNELQRAIELATHAHANQRDKQGRPYVLHLMHVMGLVDDPIAKQAAVLHDILEDTEVTLEGLREAGISERAIQAVLLLTHRLPLSYAQYIVTLSADPIAKQVKLADIQSNYGIDRVPFRPNHEVEDSKRLARYILSHQFLTGQLDLDEYVARMTRYEG